MKTCPRCGSTHVEEMGTKPGDFRWWLCRDCSLCWDDDPPSKSQRPSKLTEPENRGMLMEKGAVT